MKLKTIITIALVVGIFTTSFAQKNTENRKKKSKTFITKRLELTPEESKAFWPIFKERNEERISKTKPLRKDRIKGKKQMEEMTDNEIITLLDNVLKTKQIELDIQKEYNAKFLAVLPPKKVAKLYHIERRFKQNRKNGVNKGNQKNRKK